MNGERLQGAVERQARELRNSRFSECAALEAIQVLQDEVFAAARALDRHIAWLHDLHVRRAEEVRAGIWPPKLEASS
jgi:hypothetical protein